MRSSIFMGLVFVSLAINPIQIEKYAVAILTNLLILISADVYELYKK